jgi:predicted dehydrogenase
MKSVKSQKSRRNFISNSLLAAGGLMIVPRHVLGRGFVPPSDKLNLAAIGSGGKGFSDINLAYNKGKNNVVALCDIDDKMAAKARETFPNAKYYNDFRVMLDQSKDIDAVTISTPDHTHAMAAMAAMSLGKHVYVQKPLAHNIKEVREMTEMARTRKIVSQMGNQGSSSPGQKKMVEWFDKGLIGAVEEVHIWTDRPVWPQGIKLPKDPMPLPATVSKANWDLFIGPAEYMDYHPLFHPFKWRGWWNFGTGALGDMGCHMFDTAFRVLGLAYPTEVECSVSQIFVQDWTPEYLPESCPGASTIKLKFNATSKNNKPVDLLWYDGGIRPFRPSIIPPNDELGVQNNGVIMIGEKGVIMCGFLGLNPKLYLNNGEIMTVSDKYTGGNKYSRDDEWGHQIAWTEAVKAGYMSKEHKDLTSSFDFSGPLTESVLMGNLAIRSYMTGVAKAGGAKGMDFPGRKKLLWDGDKMKITNYDNANEFVGRKYRTGW